MIVLGIAQGAFAVESTPENRVINGGFEINPCTANGKAEFASPWEHRNSFYSANFGKWCCAGTTGHDYHRKEAHCGELPTFGPTPHKGRSLAASKDNLTR